MRILHVSPSTRRRIGGPSSLLRGLVPVQRDRGHQVTIVTTDQGAELDGDLAVPGADMRIVPAWGPIYIGAGKGLRKAVRDAVAEADVVHVHGVYSFAAVWAMREARAAGVPALVAPHGVWTEDHRPAHPTLSAAWDRLLLAPTLKHAHTVVADSAREEDRIRDRGFAPTAVMVLGVDPALHAIDTPWAERSGVLFLGRVARKKRLDLTLEMYARSGLAAEGHRLVVAGPIEPTLPYDPRAMAADLGIAEHVDFLGTVDSETRRDLLTRMRVFVLPSDDESFGMAAAEAASAGMAVVASDRVAAMLEAERDGVAITSTQDPDALAEALRWAAADDGAGTAAALCDYARERWTWEHAAQQVEDMVAGARASA